MASPLTTKMIKNQHKKINPLNFYGIRKLKVPPPHFEYITIQMKRYNLEQTVVKWIETNLRGRFYVGAVLELDHNNKQSRVLKIGFEDSKEVSVFTLGCPYLKYQ